VNKPDVEVINVGALLRSVGSGELYIYLGEATEEDFVRHNIRRMRTHKNYTVRTISLSLWNSQQ
jgi:hypothetical protein